MQYLDSRTSKAILKQAQQQQEQERMRTALGEDPDKYDAAEDDVSAPAAASDDEEFVEEDDDDTVDDPDKLDSQFEIDPSDEQVLKTFMPAGAPQRRTLADLILAKINENKTVSMAGDVRPHLDPKVIQVFEGYLTLFLDRNSLMIVLALDRFCQSIAQESFQRRSRSSLASRTGRRCVLSKMGRTLFSSYTFRVGYVRHQSGRVVRCSHVCGYTSVCL